MKNNSNLMNQTSSKSNDNQNFSYYNYNKLIIKWIFINVIDKLSYLKINYFLPNNDFK